ncbi:PepSY domain-containing protein, partial [Xanthomonas citri pv. citri]|nr:PepSY domain-containing protein [Xanthomonas citri pv. citri]
RVADTRGASGTPARMLPLEQFVARARSDWRGGEVGNVAVSLPNDAHAAVGVTQRAGNLSTDAPSILFDAITGQRLQR